MLASYKIRSLACASNTDRIFPKSVGNLLVRPFFAGREWTLASGGLDAAVVAWLGFVAVNAVGPVGPVRRPCFSSLLSGLRDT